MGNVTIYQPNSFSRSEHHFTPIQRNLVLLIQSKINRDTPVQRQFVFTKNDFAEQKGVIARGQKLVVDKKIVGFSDELVKHFASMVVLLKSHDKKFVSARPIFSNVESDQENLVVELSEKAMPIFYPLSVIEENYSGANNYTKIQAQNMVKLKGAISKKLYDILCSYQYGGTVTIPLIELRLMLGISTATRKIVDDGLFTFETEEITDTEYKTWSQLSTQLGRAINAINALKECNIRDVKMEPIKRGRKVHKVNFNYFNTNGVKNEAVDVLVNFGLSKHQAYRVLNGLGGKKEEKEAIEEVRQRWDKATYSKERKFYSKQSGQVIRNKAAFLWSLLPEVH